MRDAEGKCVTQRMELVRAVIGCLTINPAAAASASALLGEMIVAGTFEPMPGRINHNTWNPLVELCRPAFRHTMCIFRKSNTPAFNTIEARIILLVEPDA